MKHILPIQRHAIFMLALLAFAACDKDEDNAPVLEAKTFSNLYAPQTGGQGQAVGGEFTRFSFAKGDVVTDDAWDLGFRGTTLIVNGGAVIGIADEPTRTGQGAVAILNTLFEDVMEAPASSAFAQDGAGTYAIPTGSGNGWYDYNPVNHLITPIAGRVFVIKTHDGKYAKMEILSYYKDAPANPDGLSSEGRHFTFRYIYQPDGQRF